MSEIRRGHKRRVGVGTLGLIGLVIIGVAVYFSFAKRIPFVEGYRVNGYFTNANQLRKGSPVRIAGVDVGKVVKIKQGPGTTADIVMEFKNAARPIHTDATLRIRPRLFLEGGFYVELRPGSPSAPEIKDHGDIPVTQTSVPVQIDQVLTSLDHPTRQSLRRTIFNLADGTGKGAAKALGDSAKPFTPALRDTAVIAQAARGLRQHDASEGIRSLSQITGTLAANDQALNDLLQNFNTTTTVLADESDSVEDGIREAALVTRTALPSLRTINAGLPSLERFVVALRPALPDAPATLRHVSALLTQARPLVQQAELPALLTKLTPTIDRLPTLGNRLKVLFPLVTPVSDCLRDRAIPTLDTKINDGANSSGRPVWQDLVHAAVGLAGASQSFDANGPSVRYLAAAGDSSIATGSIPGIGRLVATGPQVLGSSPRWLGNGNLPPFRPDVQCRTTTPVNLQSRTPFPESGGTTQTRSSKTPDRSLPVTKRSVGATGGPKSTLRQALRTVSGTVHRATEGGR